MSTLPERDLPPGRHRLLKEHLMTEIRQEQKAAGTPARTRTKWLRPAVAVAAVAAVAATVVVALPSSDGTSGPGTSKEAAALLGDIALAAEHQKVPDHIRDDQFVYIDSKIGYSTQENDNPATLDPVHRREIWLSVDGTRSGLLEEKFHGNDHVKLEPETPGIPGNTDYRNLQRLPTDPDRMLDWLHKNSHGGKSGDQNAFVLVGDLVTESLLPPDVAAALFRAAAKIPGVVVVPDAVDAAGRRGVGVAREDGGEREELIFDAKTKEYLGERVIAVEDLPSGFKKGQITGTSAILNRTVVDKAGQRP
ncbi:CU044_5270 family protein [Streptomyces sp. NPDC058251]|uniref:CU044_5270 family protein n=1 Tax=unclassified Streptomyces TaxID=2593676 RepID=UPI0036F0F2C1